MQTIFKKDIANMLALDVLSELHQIRQKIAMFESKYGGKFEKIEESAIAGPEDFQRDDDLLEWKAYEKLEKDRLLKLEDIRHECFQIA